MLDFKARIQTRAAIIGIVLNNNQLDLLNNDVIKNIQKGITEFDALDKTFDFIKLNSRKLIAENDAIITIKKG